MRYVLHIFIHEQTPKTESIFFGFVGLVWSFDRSSSTYKISLRLMRRGNEERLKPQRIEWNKWFSFLFPQKKKKPKTSSHIIGCYPKGPDAQCSMMMIFFIVSCTA